MFTRTLLIGSAILAIATPATADPAKPAQHEAAAQAPTGRPAQVVLASAEQVQAEMPADSQAAATPPKRPRAARVTSCRCGDQAAQPEQR
jgi:hypothetical protein